MKKTGMPEPKSIPPCPPPTTFEENIIRRLRLAEKENQRLENEFKALKHKYGYFMWISLGYCFVTFLVVVELLYL